MTGILYREWQDQGPGKGGEPSWTDINMFKLVFFVARTVLKWVGGYIKRMYVVTFICFC